MRRALIGRMSAGDPSRSGVLVPLSWGQFRARWQTAGVDRVARRFNRSAISTAIVAATKSNLRLAAMPGNVRLRKGEANLERASVVNVSQLRTMDRARLVDSIGVVSPSSMRDVLLGIALVFGLDDPDIAR